MAGGHVLEPFGYDRIGYGCEFVDNDNYNDWRRRADLRQADLILDELVGVSDLILDELLGLLAMIVTDLILDELVGVSDLVLDVAFLCSAFWSFSVLPLDGLC